MAEDNIFELATLMQCAAVDPTQWVTALDAVNRFVGGSGAILLCVQDRQRFAPSSTEAAGMIDDYFARGWHENDRREACIPLLKSRGVVVDHDFQSPDDIVGCDFYHDFLVRHDCKWFAGIGVEVDGDDWCLALQRSPALGPFGPRDMDRLRQLRTTLYGTAYVSRHIGHSWRSGLQYSLDALIHPAVIFDGNARVLYLNEAATDLIGDDITLDKRVRFDDPHATTAFDAVLKRALHPRSLAPQDELIAKIRFDQGTYTCRATSLLRHERLIANSAAVLVVMERERPIPNEVLKRRYGLTDAEIKVSMAIADGRNVKEIAASNGVKEDTIRSQLKSVYGKTEINSQPRLVALLKDLTTATG